MMCFCDKQKTAYEMRISDWSSDVCSCDLDGPGSDPSLCRRLPVDGCDLRLSEGDGHHTLAGRPHLAPGNHDGCQGDRVHERGAPGDGSLFDRQCRYADHADLHPGRRDADARLDAHNGWRCDAGGREIGRTHVRTPVTN